MGRHSSGKNNYSLSGGAVAALIFVLVLLAGLIWFFASRGGDEAQEAAAPDCVAGELSLPVAASDATAGAALIDAYGETNPVVRDYCVTPELVSDIRAAAVYVAPNTPVTYQALENADRSPSTGDAEAVFSEKVGLVGASKAELDTLDVSAVRFPVGEEPAASALVASLIAPNDNEAVRVLTEQRIGSLTDFDAEAGAFAATAQTSVPEGMEFTALDGEVVYAAIPLNQNDQVDENQARAGQDFARYSASEFEGSAQDQPVISDLVWAAALPGGGQAITGGSRNQAAGETQRPNSSGSAKPRNTLFLLDTSEAMGPYIETAKEGIAQAAVGIAETGNQVALWNYSSPLNPGVVYGYRRNIDMTPDGEAVAASVRRFLTGGVPQTREALQAAAASYGETGQPTRILLVTTGTADQGDDTAFIDAVRSAAGDNVDITVVHVGGGEEDQAVDKLASTKVDAGDSPDIVAAIAQASGL